MLYNQSVQPQYSLLHSRQESSFLPVYSASHLLVLDAGIDDLQTLLKGVLPAIGVLVLRPDQDGIVQITQALQHYPDVTTLHLVSHGSPGCLYLGNTCLSLNTLDHYADQVQAWFKSSSPNLLLYACNVAVGEAGAEFLEKLHHLTGATIRASRTPIGNAELGGNWNLDACISTIPYPTSVPAFTNAAQAAYAGLLTADPTFAGGNIVLTDFGSNDYIADLALQLDGKIIVIGGVSDGSSGRDIGIVRHNTDGSLDTSFGGDGKITTSFTPPGSASGSTTPLAFTLLPSGKILVAGSFANESSGSSRLLLRYNADGSLDSSFGNAGSVFEETSSFFIGAITLQSDNKMIVPVDIRTPELLNGVYTFPADFGFIRYNPDGSRDLSLGTGGTVRTDFTDEFPGQIYTTDDSLGQFLIQPDGKTVGVGHTFVQDGSYYGQYLSLARYNLDGSLDTSFSGNGKTVIKASNFPRNAVLQADGKILVVSYVNLGNYGFLLSRFNTDGSVDTSFGSGGSVFTDVLPGDDFIHSVAIRPDGRIVVVGTSQGASTVVRYNPNGTLDTSFGANGITVINTKSGFTNIQLQPDGRIVLAGTSSEPNSNFAVTRLLPETPPGITAVGNSSQNTFNSTTGSDTFTGGGGNDTFVFNLGDGTDIVTDFGGVGKGSNPTSPVLANADTLKFQGTGLSANKLLLTQVGADLEVSFAGNKVNKVILKNFVLENLDNHRTNSGASANVTNVLFNGESFAPSYDVLDVLDANSTRTTVFKKNTTTFLNDLDNEVSGYEDSDDVINGQGGNDYLRGRDGKDTLRGGAGKDVLLGGSNNDLLVGDGGSDYLDGGKGNDFLAGGAGIDKFVFNTEATFSTEAGVDIIEDFNIAVDKVVLDKTTFTGLASVVGNGFSNGSEFAIVNNDSTAETVAALIVYNSTNGRLFYNRNGNSSGFGSGSLFASLYPTLEGYPALTASDFVIKA